jgi:hypothetical protein
VVFTESVLRDSYDEFSSEEKKLGKTMACCSGGLYVVRYVYVTIEHFSGYNLTNVIPI